MQHITATDAGGPGSELRRALVLLGTEAPDPYDLLNRIEDDATRYVLAWHTLRCAVSAMVGDTLPAGSACPGIGMLEVAGIVCWMLVEDDTTHLLPGQRPQVRAMLDEAISGGVVMANVATDVEKALYRVSDLVELCPNGAAIAVREALAYLLGENPVDN